MSSFKSIYTADFSITTAIEFIIYLEFNVILPITTQEEFEDTKS